MVSNPTILVVDDFPDGREMVSEYLAFRGYTVIEAATGAEALALAREHQPRVILMDLGMPGMDGWQATRALKADPRTKSCIVIALTAHALQSQQLEARNAGCDDVIAKPFDLAALVETLEPWLKRRSDRVQPSAKRRA
jgi:CheY-like chemotaxis protein